ncbi:[protein-PII] uridylyltransferase [Luteimonas sp. MC1572]|uniref:[protein-PII] uridylyltransferase n=1 Tax=Luteimonas sp. MC1572 TaxID=2799325 RepID=UPI0018F0AA29|nr:[protein-PII] uridylyltransferase [Luteimonas sp. MC1572]MBJ6980472.1 [protein-PII] uridylyltransferase [Luteimonas sp. MC1572]QQO04351.1 [protein-PII] uridylyltransferase [Luteimonas sp. MC1572]
MPPDATGCTPREGDAGWALEQRESLLLGDAELAGRFDLGIDADRLTALRARAVDAIVVAAWRRCLPADADAALFAVGGYGRGELFPHSDIDLLVLAEPEAQERHREALARFIALLWDAGLAASHATRSPEQCTAAAVDLTVMTALLDARALVAHADAVAALARAIAPDRAWPARDFYLAKADELARRHARFGDTSDNLEPNLKEGPGGLRDLQTVGWMARRAFGTHELQPLVALGQVGADEAAALDRERRALGRLRFGLHLVAGRAEERLRFDHQKPLAARLGFSDDGDNLGVEQMMQGFYQSAAVVRRIGDRLLQRFEEHFDGTAAPEPVDDDFELRRGYLAARDHHWPHGDIGAVFALFATWARLGELRGLHTHTARALAEALPALPAYGDATPEARAAFMALLRGPVPVRTLERMARLGVLGRWIPAFAQVSGRMQFDLFHMYTVDQHTLAVLRNLAAFAGDDADARFSMAHEVWPTLRKPELLLLAGLFHDIAKGRGGDHSELGAVDARAFGEAHGLGEGDTALVEWLVRKHLLMSITAQKQDISDPAVIHRFATEVADRERLDHLYLLTCADIAGTSPKLWNAWKDRLLADLRNATRLALRRGLEHPVAAGERIVEAHAAAKALLAADGVAEAEADALLRQFPEASFLRARPEQIAWQARALRESGGAGVVVRARLLAAGSQAMEVFVHGDDRDGLFAAIVITLDRLGLEIQHARALDGPGGAIFDSFQVLPADARVEGDVQGIARELAAVLAAPLDRVRPARRAQPRHLRHFRILPQVDFATVGDGGATVLSLVCTDRPGLLADVAHVLRRQGLRVHDARIATFGARAEDVFRITGQDNKPLDQDACARLHEALLARIDGEPPA